MATSEAKEMKKQETLVRFSIISYKTRLRVVFFLKKFLPRHFRKLTANHKKFLVLKNEKMFIFIENKLKFYYYFFHFGHSTFIIFAYT